jgi:hypothetical protein
MKKRLPQATARVRSKRIELLILSHNKRACCVCRAGDRPIHIHHIDGMPGHAEPGNLAVLCIPHHDQATAGLNSGQVGLGRKLTPHEVRFHKKTWERLVAEESAWRKRFAPQDSRKQALILFEFDLLRTRNEILASRTVEEAENRFNYLTCLRNDFFRPSDSAYRKLLLSTYAELAGRGMEAKPIALAVVKAVERDYRYLDAAHTGKLSRTDKWAMTQSARMLGQVGYWAVLFGTDFEVVYKVCAALTELFDIGISLGFKQLKAEIRDAFDRMESEIQRMPLKRKASTLTREHLKFISLALGRLER